MLEALSHWADDWSTTSIILGNATTLVLCEVAFTIDRAWIIRHQMDIQEGIFASKAEGDRS